MEHMPMQPHEGHKIDMDAQMEVELLWNYESPDGQAAVETYPAEGKYEMKIRVGSEEREIDLGSLGAQEAQKVHRQAVDFLESRAADIRLAAKATADTLAREVKARLKEAEGK